MSGKVCIGYSSGNMKCFLDLDKGQTDVHGRDKVAGIHQRLKKRLLARKDAGVVDQGGNVAVAVDEKDGQGVDDGVAA